MRIPVDSTLSVMDNESRNNSIFISNEELKFSNTLDKPLSDEDLNKDVYSEFKFKIVNCGYGIKDSQSQVGGSTQTEQQIVVDNIDTIQQMAFQVRKKELSADEINRIRKSISRKQYQVLGDCFQFLSNNKTIIFAIDIK